MSGWLEMSGLLHNFMYVDDVTCHIRTASAKAWEYIMLLLCGVELCHLERSGVG